MAEARGSVVVAGVHVPTVAVDFDNTIADERDHVLPGAKDALLHLRKTGWRIIVWTARDAEGQVDAEKVLNANGIPFDYINENPPADELQKSRKVFFHATVDDKAIPFDGNWPAIIMELDRRRSVIEAEVAKGVRLMVMDEEGNPRQMALFALENGRAVEKTGVTDPALQEIMSGLSGDDGLIFPNDGSQFLSALMGVQGTYLWAEVSG